MSPRNPEFEDCIGVFQGGGCRASAYAGAFKAAVAHGVNFDELAGASAGAIVATLVAAGAEPTWLEQQLCDLDFSSLLRKPSGKRFATRGRNRASRVWNLLRFGGLHSGSGIEAWMEERLRELLPTAVGQRVVFADLPKAVSVIAGDIKQRRQVVWSSQNTPDMSVAEAVRSSCSIPVFFQPNHGMYVDGGIVSNLPIHIVENDESDQRRILAFSLIDSGDPVLRRDLVSMLAAVTSTVVDGAQDIQSSLRGDFDVINIRTGDVRATDFARMTSERVEALVNAGRQAVDDFFGRSPVSAKPRPQVSESTHLAQTLTLVAESMLKAQNDILISAAETSWVFDTFPALLIARLNNVRVRIVLPTYAGARPDDLLQRGTLAALGCQIALAPADVPMPIRALVVDPNSHAARAVVAGRPNLKIHARLFTAADGDEQLIALIADGVTRWFPEPLREEGGTVKIIKLDPERVFENLRTVEQYRTGQQMELVEVPLHRIDAWARYAHMYKQVQQEAMVRQLRAFGLEQFEPHAVVYGTGQMSMAVPIVLEASPNGRYTVVNGLSRLLLLKREGQNSATCVVVRGVTAEPPAPEVRKLSDLGVRVGKRGDAEHRYPGFAYRNIRGVEKTAHQLVPEGGEGQ